MADLRTTIANVRGDGRQRDIRCPAHDDHRASLSVGRGADGRVLVKCHAGCSVESLLGSVGLTMDDLHEQRNGHRSEIVAEYDYTDEDGKPYQVVRFQPKDFRQRQPDNKGGWVWSLKGIQRTLYRLSELQGQSVVYVTEGEKDVHALGTVGIVATTNAGGAGKWREDYIRQLQTAGVQSVVILPDNDDPGRTHAAQVAQSCHAAGLQVKVVTLPDLPAKGDVSDWLAAGHTRDALVAIVKATALYTATPAAPYATADPLGLTGIDTLMAEPDDALDWLVEDRFACGSVNLIAGRPKAGKSTLARALALAVARGERWLGHRCQPGRVVYLALEDKRSEVRRHLRAMGASGQEPIRFLIGGAPRDLLQRLEALVASGDTIDLLIIDTAQRLLTVKDTNDYALVTAAFEPVLALARTHGTCIVLLHHAGKADRAGIEAILGSTAWAASVDNVVMLNRTERYRLVSTIQRIGPDLDETVVLMDEQTGDVRMGGSRYLVDIAAVTKAMLDLLQTAGGPGLRQDTLLADVEARRDLKLKALHQLSQDPLVERLGAGTRNHPYYFKVRREPETQEPERENTSSLVPPIRVGTSISTKTVIGAPKRNTSSRVPTGEEVRRV